MQKAGETKWALHRSLRETQGSARQRVVAHAEALNSTQVADVMLSQERLILMFVQTVVKSLVKQKVNSPAFFTNMF